LKLSFFIILLAISINVCDIKSDNNMSFDKIPIGGIHYTCDISDDTEDIHILTIHKIPRYFDIEINAGRPSRQFSVYYKYDTGDYSELIYREGCEFTKIRWAIEEVKINMNVPMRAENFTMEIRTFSYGITTFEITIKNVTSLHIFKVDFLLFPLIVTLSILYKKLNNI